MSKRYRPWKIDEPMPLPATVQEFVDKDHLARFVLSLLVEEIDLDEIERVSRVERGQPPFDPAMMTALLLYGYCNGVYSSRRIAKACRERVDFMSMVGFDPPDFPHHLGVPQMSSERAVEPSFDFGVLMGGVIVDDQMQVEALGRIAEAQAPCPADRGKGRRCHVLCHKILGRWTA